MNKQSDLLLERRDEKESCYDRPSRLICAFGPLRKVITVSCSAVVLLTLTCRLTYIAI